jgi:hypothetical protein
MEPGNVIDMEMTDKQVHGFFLGDITVRFGDAVTRIKDNIILFGLHKDRTCVTGNRIVPTVGPEECHLHGVDICILYQKRNWCWYSSFFLSEGSFYGQKKWNLLLFGNKIPQKIDRNLPKKKVIAGHSPLF